MLSYRKLAMRVLGRPLHTGGGYRFTPSGLSAGSSACPDRCNASPPLPPRPLQRHGTSKMVTLRFRRVRPKGQTKSHRGRSRRWKTPAPSSQIVRRTLPPTP